MQATVLAPALFAIKESFSEHQSAAFMTRLVLVAPTIAIVLSASAVGLLLDRARKQYVLAASLVLYAACGVACFLAADSGTDCDCQVRPRLSLAAIATRTTALIGDYFAGPTREAMFGWQNALRGMANTAFPILGAAIALADWRLIFLVNLVAILLLWPTLALPSVAPVQATQPSAFSYADALLIYGLSFLGLSGLVSVDAPDCVPSQRDWDEVAGLAGR